MLQFAPDLISLMPSRTYPNSALPWTRTSHCHKQVYHYLKGMINLSITYSGNNTSDIILYSDADWGNNLDDQWSVSGYVSALSGGATTWSSKKQPTMALSSMEADYMALANTTQDNSWIRQLFTELDEPLNSPMHIFVNNCSTIEYTMNAGFHAHSKHINIWHHFIWDSITSCEVSVHYCVSEENIANIFMKPLPTNEHDYLVAKLSMNRVWRGMLWLQTRSCMLIR